jgi:hypothetical protein
MVKFQPNQEFGITPFKTPDPSRPGCRVAVSLADFTFSEIPTLGTRLEDSDLNVTKKNNTWNDHVFAGVEEGPKGWIYFLFNPPLTTPETAFRTYPASEEYFWPPVLKDLGAVIAATNPGGTPLYAFDGARYAYVEGVSIDTEILVEEFLSATPFSREFILGEEPIPTPIDARVLTGRISFPACLHPEIEIPMGSFTSSQTAPVQFVDYVVKDSTLDFDSPHYFAQTNFLSWDQFTKTASVRVTETNLYHAVKKTFYPPNVNLFTIR